MWLAAAVLGLSPGAAALAQNSADRTVPPPSLPSVESYSLPPGARTTPEDNGVQGPVDPDIPTVRPTIVAPRAPPTRPAPDTRAPVEAPAIIDSEEVQARQPASPPPGRTQPQAESAAPESGPDGEKPAVQAEPRLAPVETPVSQQDALPAMAEPSAEAVPGPPSSSWHILLVAGLFFALLAAMFVWRRRHAPPIPPTAAESDLGKPRPAALAADAPEPTPTVPEIAVSFQPKAASATLFNAVVGFELELSNRGDDRLTGIAVHGTMNQSGEKGAADQTRPASSPLGDIPELQSGETCRIDGEFRVALASIRPIRFRAQALFVPLIEISIEFIDHAGFKHFQSASFLVGLEHQPPRSKMAPFRLDLGPRSFAPLGSRPLAKA